MKLQERLRRTYRAIYKFPSPCGELVMKLAAFAANVPYMDIEEFPSPCGELVMKPTILRPAPFKDRKVFPSPCGELVMKQISTWDVGDHILPSQAFPSPCGELVMKL